MPETTTLDLHAFVDAVADGFYAVDTGGSCLFVNASALRLLGYDDPAELIGRNMHEAIHHTRVDGSAYPRGGTRGSGWRSSMRSARSWSGAPGATG